MSGKKKGNSWPYYFLSSFYFTRLAWPVLFAYEVPCTHITNQTDEGCLEELRTTVAVFEENEFQNPAKNNNLVCKAWLATGNL